MRSVYLRFLSGTGDAVLHARNIESSYLFSLINNLYLFSAVNPATGLDLTPEDGITIKGGDDDN